jgi:hypothetical protein
MSPVLFVLVSLGLISALLASVMIQAWRSIDRAPHLLAWAAAHTAAALQWLCMLLDQMQPVTGGFFWLLANALAITVLSCLLIGYRLRSGLVVGRVLLAGSGLLALAAVVWFSALVPQPVLSATVVPLYASILLALCCHAVLSRGHPVLPAEWGSVVVLVLFLALLLGTDQQEVKDHKDQDKRQEADKRAAAVAPAGLCPGGRNQHRCLLKAAGGLNRPNPAHTGQ